MTDLDLECPGKPGTPNYAAAAAYLLARTADVWTEGITAARLDQHDLTLQYREEADAERVARLLGINDPPRERGQTDSGGYRREGVVNGITVHIVSCWLLDADGQAIT